MCTCMAMRPVDHVMSGSNLVPPLRYWVRRPGSVDLVPTIFIFGAVGGQRSTLTSLVQKIHVIISTTELDKLLSSSMANKRECRGKQRNYVRILKS